MMPIRIAATSASTNGWLKALSSSRCNATARAVIRTHSPTPGPSAAADPRRFLMTRKRLPAVFRWSGIVIP